MVTISFVHFSGGVFDGVICSVACCGFLQAIVIAGMQPAAPDFRLLPPKKPSQISTLSDGAAAAWTGYCIASSNSSFERHLSWPHAQWAAGHHNGAGKPCPRTTAGPSSCATLWFGPPAIRLNLLGFIDEWGLGDEIVRHSDQRGGRLSVVKGR